MDVGLRLQIFIFLVLVSEEPYCSVYIFCRTRRVLILHKTLCVVDRSECTNIFGLLIALNEVQCVCDCGCVSALSTTHTIFVQNERNDSLTTQSTVWENPTTRRLSLS